MIGIDEIVQEVEILKADIGLSTINPPDGITLLIQQLLDGQMIRALSPVEIREISVRLCAYAFFLQTQENRLVTFINFCEANLKHLVGKNTENVPGSFFQEKDLYIRAREPNAVAISKKKAMASARLDSVKFLAMRVDKLAEMLSELARVRHG